MTLRFRLPSVAILVVGLVVLGVGAWESTDPEYVHEVEPATQAEYERAATETGGPFAYEYSELSQRSQEAFRSARESPNGRTAVSEANLPPEFTYGTGPTYRYYVAYDGEYYLLTPRGPGQNSGLVDVAAGALAVLGALVSLTGGVGLWRQRRRGESSE